MTNCAPGGCQCPCHIPGMRTSHLVACCDKLPALENDRTAMMLGLVPDKRTPNERLLDAVRTGGKTLEYVYDGPESDDCTCTYYVVGHSDPERYHPENMDREPNPTCPQHQGI